MESGQFSHLVNRGSFADRGVFSIWTDEKPVTDQILGATNVGILSNDSFYARCLSGTWSVTGNPVKVVYGKATRLPRVPPCQLIAWSEEVPLTGAQISLCVRDVLPGAERVEVAQLEFTRDVEGLSIPYVRRHLVHRARSWDEFSDGRGRQTLYFGSRGSPWQLVVYDRAPNILRFEVVFRRAFLVQRGLCRLDELVKLRSLDMQQMFSLRQVSAARVLSETEALTNESFKELLRDWDYWGHPLQWMYRALRSGGIDPDSILRRSSRQLQLERMQRNFVW